jgi:ferredoxin
MNMMIGDNCINCGACALECNMGAVSKPKFRKRVIRSRKLQSEHYSIVNELCNQCEGYNFYKCVEICPMNAIVKN